MNCTKNYKCWVLHFHLIWNKYIIFCIKGMYTDILTYSIEQSPSSEATWFSASQEIPCILWNLKVHYHIHKCPPPVPILNQLDPDHTPTIHFLKIHLNVILQLCLALPNGLILSRFPTKTLYLPLLSPISATCPAYLILLDFITQTILGEYRSLNSSLYTFSTTLLPHPS
jgi:hypothetical protein